MQTQIVFILPSLESEENITYYKFAITTNICWSTFELIIVHSICSNKLIISDRRWLSRVK